MILNHFDQLESLRHARGLEALEVDMDPFLGGNLPLYLCKFAIWALAPGGQATLIARRAIDNVGLVPRAWSFQFLVQAACKAIEGWGEITSVHVGERKMTFKRTHSAVGAPTWSAVVMFSGREAEMPAMARCIQGLQRQRPLREGGQICVCGPAEAERLIQADFPAIEYLACETPSQAGRFLTGQKKNYAISRVRGDKVLVCHSRIVLDDGCLEALPPEFEVITPRVEIEGQGGKRLPYSDLSLTKLTSTFLFTPTVYPFLGYPRREWLSLVRDYYPYIDGGLFCVDRSLALQVPLSNTVAWGEGEDVEWCLRLLGQGKVLELCLEASALSTIHKTNYYIKWAHLSAYRLVSHLMRRARAFATR